MFYFFALYGSAVLILTLFVGVISTFESYTTRSLRK